MSTINENDLPVDITVEQSVEAAYSHEIAEVTSKLNRGLPCLIECDKEVTPYIFMNLRGRLREFNMRCRYLDGRPREGDQQGPVPMGLMGTMISQLRDAVRGATEQQDNMGNPIRTVIVLPHLDLLVTSSGGLTGEAREVIVLLYENPTIVFLGFKDPSFPLPKVIDTLFPHRIDLLGIARDRLPQLIAQREARKFGEKFNPWGLYKYVSGVNPVRLRRLLSTLEGEDYPADAKQAYRQLRQATLTGALEIPDVSLDNEIGGYTKVKKRLKQEILDVLTRRDAATSEDQVKSLEELLPRGMIFWGPPGTGKTYFAKAIASAIGAAITIVSGPELKSKWVGESLPYEEEVFVILNGKPQRIAIGELVENHSKDDVQTWTVRDDGSALLAPVTGFLKHKGPDYIDVLVTETGREVRVTGGHSLFVEKDGKLGEVFAEEIEAGKTRIAIPRRLEAPETVRELNLLEMLSGREDTHVQGYDEQVEQAIESVGFETANALTGVVVHTLTHKRRPPLSIAAFERLMAGSDSEISTEGLNLYCHHREKNLPATIPLTPELGEFLGRWVADGCYYDYGVRIATHVDEADQVQGMCEHLFGHVTHYCKGENQKGVDLIINSILLKRIMQDGLELQDGSGNKRVPAFMFAAPKPVIAAFLRGYFSGDGTFTRKYIEATTISQELAKDITTLLQYFGIIARIRTKNEKKGQMAYRIRFLWTGFLKIFAEEIGFADERRQSMLRNYLSNIKLKRDLQSPARNFTNDVYWDKVVEKRREPYSREHVYDLSVPETERFIAGFGNILVHNSEENLRQIFYKARQSAPAIIVFDELDSFATARGTYTGSGVEHSMVNQLLTEMDGFHKEELVFVVGTTNFVESLDPALLRPGRFEFHLHIPYPEADDRREIIKIYDKKMRLKMTEAAIEYTVKRTGDYVIGAAAGTRYSGDHLNAVCRGIARVRLRDGLDGPTEAVDVERSMTEYLERPTMTPTEENVLATHEAGHAVVSLHCPHAPAIERITIASEMHWAFGYVRHADPHHKYIQTINFYLDMICVALGAREAEKVFLNDISLGATGDLNSATMIARELVEVHGYGAELVQYRNPFDERGIRTPGLSEKTREELDERVKAIVETQRVRAEKIIKENKGMIEVLRDLLLEKKTIDTKMLAEVAPAKVESKKPKKKAE